MQAKDIMTVDVITARPDTPVEEVARILLNRRISGVPVIDVNGHVIGIVSEGDLMRRPESDTLRQRSWWLGLVSFPNEQAVRYVKTHGRNAEAVMTRDVLTITEETPAREIAEILESRHIKRVPVVRQGKIVGIVSRADLLRALASGDVETPLNRDDTVIRQAVIDALDRELGIAVCFVNVIVQDGVVHLWGSVETETERNAARLAAENSPGVKTVKSYLKLSPAISGGWI